MSITKTNSIALKIAIGLIGVAFAFALLFGSVIPAHAALTQSQIDAIISLLQSFGADQATINNVQTSLSGGTPTTGGSTSTASVCPYTWSTNLTTGSAGADVLALQKFLNSDSATQIASSGIGSAGQESDYFGSLTKAAVAKFQNKYASEILTPVGLSVGTGYLGASSRAKANSLCSSAPTTGGDTDTTGGDTTTTPAPVGTGLSVVAGTQPVATLAPDSAARVPFTSFTVTAGSDGDVVMDSVTVERKGLAPDAVFSGIVLLDQDGIQIGTSKTLNSNHQTTVGDKVTISAGTSKKFTVAGNMATDNSSRDGTIANLSVIGINTSATVSGSLPITGTSQTINASLAIGSVTMGISSFDPNSAQSKEIGITGVRFAGITVTAGSAEEVRVNSIRWNQTGSAGSGDLANVVTVVNGVEYSTTVSSDGKFYTSKLGSGIVIGKGNLIDIYVKGDIIGGASRTVVFDIDKTTDLNITGEVFGYGITPPAGSGTAATTSSAFLAGTPWFDNAHLSITAGSVSTVQRSASVPAQNIAVNVPDQPLGAFETDIKGEAINISGITITVASTTGSGTGLLTNVTLVDQNGSVVAGPVDAEYTSALAQTVTFTDSMTIPTGKQIYSVKGKVASTIGNGGTYIVSVTPSGWTSPVGDVTGNSITISQTEFSLNTMTVKAAALSVTISPNPVEQNITSGPFTFTNYQFDATQSGEDVRFSSFKPKLTFADIEVTEISACQVFDGTTALNTGSNVLTPSVATGNDETITFDQTLVITKGTVKTLALKCTIAGSTGAGDSLSWGIANTAANIIVTGVTSQNAVTETVTASIGQTMTVQSGTLVASEDAASPAYAIVKAGTTGVNHGIINFRASNENITLQRVGLTLTNSASSTSSDLVQVTLWDGGTQVGSAVFTGANTNATSTLSVPVVISKDTDKDITVKIDLANVGTSASGNQGALLAVDIDVNTNTQGVGSSGTTINATGSTSFNGTRMFSSYPTITKQSVPTTVLTNGVMDLYKFSITSSAGGNGIGLHQLTVNLATSTASAVSGTTTVTLLDVYAYTDSAYSQPVPGFTSGKVITQLASLASSGDNDAQLTSILQIPTGATYYFRVTGTVTLTAGTGTFSGSVTTRLGGDATYPTLATLMGARASVDGNANGDNIVWSPNATTTSSATHVDWTNGFNISGLPSDGSEVVTLSK